MEEKKKDKYRCIGLMVFQVAFAICALIFVFLRFTLIWGVIKRILQVLSPIFIGVVLCYLCSPLYNLIKNKLEERKLSVRISKAISTVICVFAVAFVIYGLIALIIPQLIDSLASLYRQIPDYLDRFTKEFDRFVSEKRDLAHFIGANGTITEYLMNFVENVIVPNVDKIATSLLTYLKNVAVWLYNFIIGLVAMCYLLNIKEKLLPQCKKIIYAVMRPRSAKYLCNELKEMNKVFGGFITGKLLDSLIIGVICFIVLSIIGMPYTLLVSVIVGVTNIIPFFGPFIGAIPSALIITIISPKMGLIFVIFILILQQIDGNVIGPKILGDSTGLSSFWILFSILLFGGLFGFAGMVLAVPTWALIMRGLRKLIEKGLEKKKLPLKTDAYELGKEVEAEEAGAEKAGAEEAETEITKEN
ncbi:MAG: AI-2E family transporter [Lachnospiraceae bacterium]|nr:AI-2E family transporter [Lachnospiraceae bacterium]